MKEKITDKKSALLEATLYLVNNKGFHDAPMAKIAKLAKVAPATIYLYFENKQDLINQLYLTVKANFSQHAFADYDPQKPVKKGFEAIWHNIASYKLNHLDEAMFLSQCDITPMIDQKSKQQGLLHLQPLLDLWTRGQQEGVIKDISPYLLYAYTVHPLSFLISVHQKGDFEITSTQLEEAFNLTWDGIKK
ncbi:AcrR family transcriptional regulator [Dyadobacter jejuensis]|uniref:AcrR family transcriptional regulator n=1 Tax=Dyadobacter jejuensis TaxID=1082580 RepID=A0A316ABB5_9BACT|nr:TetR/AcrR family transcriptional regulator [Dyadobacter jejuensis]PWJ55015.1 AcrR family transcriptional regulator [Dyadobacter jejuensis]